MIDTLRDPTIGIKEFREFSHKLSSTLASESTHVFSRPPVLVAILRSGLALLREFSEKYPDSRIGLIGTKRDEKTQEPHLYFSNLPKIDEKDPIFLLDPMVATGRTAVCAIENLKQAGAVESQIVLICFLATPQGLSHIEEKASKVRVQPVHIDKGLDASNKIVPGLGDFGERYFGA